MSKISEFLNNASLEEKIGQMFIARTPQNVEQAIKDIEDYRLGGLIVYDADMMGLIPVEFRKKLDKFQAAAEIPLLIGIDQEGGRVSRLTHSGLIAENKDQFAFPRQQYAHAEQSGVGSGMKMVKRYASQNAKILRTLGINWNFAPDADVSHAEKGFIYDRTFSSSYEQTAKYISEVVPAWQKNDLIAATLKHFPGYGDAADTHTGFAVRSETLDYLKTHDMLPFIAGIKAGVDSIMVTHVIYDQIDPENPATLSAKIIDLIRQECAFKGVVVTDALEMGAISDFAQEHHQASVDVLAVKAGNDMIMNADYATGIAEIATAVRNGEISERRIDDSVKRILGLKEKLRLGHEDKVREVNHMTITQLNSAKLSKIKKEIKLKRINQDPGQNEIQIYGRVSDPAAEGSLLISAYDQSGKLVATAVVGGEGKFELKIVNEAENGQIWLIALDPQYQILDISI